MKILYFTNKPAPYRVKFFNQLNKNNEVDVLFNYNGIDDRNPMWYKNNKYEFKSIYIKRFGLFQLNKILNKNKYDVVIIGTYASLNGAFFNILLRMKKIKFFINADGGLIPNKESFISKKLKQTFLSTANYYLSSGKETNKYLTYYGAKKENIFIYPFSSLNKDDILNKPIPYEEKLKLRQEKGLNYKHLFISVGSFIDIKGYDLFLKAISNNKLKDTGFLIIGGGTKKSEYESIISDNNMKNIHLIDFCDKKTVFDYYKMSDVFFFNSKGDVWGLVINEAMACGLPIISSYTTLAAKELIDENNLYCCDDFERINSKVKEYAKKSSTELYNEGMNNLNKIKNYTIENTTKEHIKIFENVINGRR